MRHEQETVQPPEPAMKSGRGMCPLLKGTCLGPVDGAGGGCEWYIEFRDQQGTPQGGACSMVLGARGTMDTAQNLVRLMMGPPAGQPRVLVPQ